MATRPHVIGVLNTSDDTVELLRMCLEAEALQHCRWVLTSTNPPRVRQLQPDSADEQIHEIIGKPYDLQEIVDSVKRELTGRGVTGNDG